MKLQRNVMLEKLRNLQQRARYNLDHLSDEQYKKLVCNGAFGSEFSCFFENKERIKKGLKPLILATFNEGKVVVDCERYRKAGFCKLLNRIEVEERSEEF
jgi:hypothetical protein